MNKPYLEEHSALSRPLIVSCLVAPVAAGIICLVLGLALHQPWFFVILCGPLVAALMCSGLLYRNWPTGIRIDEAGISIGAVGSARAARRRPTVTHQAWGLFTAPWPAVAEARVVTDAAELREMRTSPRYYTLNRQWGGKAAMGNVKVGVLAAPLMRAALVIEVNPFQVTASEIGPARYYSNFKDGHFSHLIRPESSPVWVVPTRRPSALAAALAAVPGARDRANGPRRP
jgi:hypothetical protein